jgi:hypothetical protein
MPLLKSTHHAPPDEPAYCEDVKKYSVGVFRKAVESMDGLVRVKSTMVCSSILPGKRQPEKPPKTSAAQ